jgi:hypothetical protein
MIYFHTKFHITSSDGSLAITAKQKLNLQLSFYSSLKKLPKQKVYVFQKWICKWPTQNPNVLRRRKFWKSTLSDASVTSISKICSACHVHITDGKQTKCVKVVGVQCGMMFLLSFMKICSLAKRLLGWLDKWMDRHMEVMLLEACLS